jgi:RluA family pseudouridine synthase
MQPNPDWVVAAKDVLYEDDWLIVVNKPSGVPSQPTFDRSRSNCLVAVGEYLRSAYVGQPHRLDVGTSGALVFAKTAQVNANLCQQFKQHSVRKRYRTFVCQCNERATALFAQEKVLLTGAIGEEGKVRGQLRYCVGGRNCRPAQTLVHCESVWKIRGALVGLFGCEPLTGRTHQIRVHFWNEGCWMVGDNLYLPQEVGAFRYLKSIAPKRLCLHSYWIGFVHPVSGEIVEVGCEMPDDLTEFARKLGRS